MTTTAPTPAAPTKKHLTGYTVLRRVLLDKTTSDLDEGGPTYEVVAKDILSASGRSAITYYAHKAGSDAVGTYVAVPSRSFTETTVKVETQTIVKLA